MNNNLRARPLVLNIHRDRNEIVLPNICGISVWKNNGVCPGPRTECPKILSYLWSSLLTLYISGFSHFMVSMSRASPIPWNVRVWHH